MAQTGRYSALNASEDQASKPGQPPIVSAPECGWATSALTPPTRTSKHCATQLGSPSPTQNSSRQVQRIRGKRPRQTGCQLYCEPERMTMGKPAPDHRFVDASWRGTGRAQAETTYQHPGFRSRRPPVGQETPRKPSGRRTGPTTRTHDAAGTPGTAAHAAARAIRSAVIRKLLRGLRPGSAATLQPSERPICLSSPPGRY